MLSTASFQHDMLHWWYNHPGKDNIVCVIQPRDQHSKPKSAQQQAWDQHVLLAAGGGPYPTTVMAVLEPLISESPQQRALDMMHPTHRFLVGFDVWWKRKKKPSKGYLPLPSWQHYYDLIHVHVPPRYLTFYQMLLPDRGCGFYFDVDVDDPNYDLPSFVQALFEAIVAQLGPTKKCSVEDLWVGTFLLDASCNLQGLRLKSSSHGVCHILPFAHNHTSMKAFAQAMYARLEENPKVVRAFHRKTKKWIIPLDLSVYSKYRNFRFYRNIKMTADNNDVRPLVVAPYNRFPIPPNADERTIFELSIIPQPSIVSVVHSSPLSPLSIVQKRAKTEETKEVKSSPLEKHLLEQLRQWGNHDCTVNQVNTASNKWAKGSLYVSFSNRALRN